MATLKKRIEDPREITDPNVVKVVTDLRGRRHLLFPLPDSLRARRAAGARVHYFKHIGLYVYRRDFLLGYSDAAGGTAGTGRAPGTVARARKRLSHPGRGNRIRIAGRGYAGGSGTGVQLCSKHRLQGVEVAWLSIIFVTGGVVSSLGEGHRRRVHRLPAGKPRAESHAARSSIRI